jgi:ATP-dependent DNA helicase RecG
MADERNNILKKSVKSIKGVGDSRAALLSRLGIFTVEDLITHFPREYEDRRQLKPIYMLEDGETAAFEGTVASAIVESRPRRGMTIQKLIIKGENATITAVWFNQSYLKNIFSIGDRYVFLLHW